MNTQLWIENKKELERKVKHYWIYLVIVWSIHNLEEAMTMSKWIGSNKDKLPIAFLNPIQTIQQTLPIAFIIVTVLIIVIALFAVIKKWDNCILGIVLGIFLVNAIQHILITLVFRQYSPGVITAFFINLPMSIFILRQLLKQKLLKNFTWIHIFGYGAIAMAISISLIWILAICLYKVLT